MSEPYEKGLVSALVYSTSFQSLHQEIENLMKILLKDGYSHLPNKQRVPNSRKGAALDELETEKKS